MVFIALTPIAAQNPSSGSYADFIRDHFEYAIEVKNECGVPIGLTLCQAIAESQGGGRSFLAEHQNNFFGIQTGDNWNGDSAFGYRCYESARESFLDYGQFMYDYYPNAMGKHPDHFFRYCTGYAEDGYWDYLRMLYYNLGLHVYD